MIAGWRSVACVGLMLDGEEVECAKAGKVIGLLHG